MWTPTAGGELCSYCLTGHGPTWGGDPGTAGLPRMPRTSLIILACALTLEVIVGMVLVLCGWSAGWWIIGGAVLMPPMMFLIYRADLRQFRAEESAK